MGTAIKLLATSRKVGDQYYAMVSPVMIDAKNPLYSVNGVFNAIFIHGNVLGDAMFYGSGAGKLPTASAVVADVVDCAKNKGRNIMMSWSEEKLNLLQIDDVKSRFFVRVSGHAAERQSEIEELFGKVEIVAVPSLSEEFAFITGEITEQEYREKAEKLDGIQSSSKSVRGVRIYYRRNHRAGVQRKSRETRRNPEQNPRENLRSRNRHN